MLSKATVSRLSSFLCETKVKVEYEERERERTCLFSSFAYSHFMGFIGRIKFLQTWVHEYPSTRTRSPAILPSLDGSLFQVSRSLSPLFHFCLFGSNMAKQKETSSDYLKTSKFSLANMAKWQFELREIKLLFHSQLETKCLLFCFLLLVLI